MTKAEVLARSILDRAMDGNQQAQELVIDRVEGKAGKASDIKPPDTTIEDQIGRAEVEALNALVPPVPDNEDQNVSHGQEGVRADQ
jgi:hypothetical protein